MRVAVVAVLLFLAGCSHDGAALDGEPMDDLGVADEVDADASHDLRKPKDAKGSGADAIVAADLTSSTTIDLDGGGDDGDGGVTALDLTTGPSTPAPIGMTALPATDLVTEFSDVKVVDLDHDGIPDLVSTTGSTPGSLWALGRGDGTLGQAHLLPICMTMSTADFNGDGWDDLVCGSTLFYAQGPGEYDRNKYSWVDNSSTASQTATGDFNEDGRPDVVFFTFNGNTMTPFLKKATAGFDKGTVRTVGYQVNNLRAVDFDGDSHLDLVGVRADGSAISVVRGNGDGTFAAETLYSTAAKIRTLAIGDVDGDGKRDLVTSCDYGAKESVLVALSSQSYSPQTIIAAGGNDYGDVDVGDLDGDGRADLVLVDWTAHDVVVRRSLGAGAFAPAVRYPTVLTGRLALADWTHDGKLDVGVAGVPQVLQVLPGVGDGTLLSHSELARDRAPLEIRAADLNGDGLTDFVLTDTAGINSSTVSVYLAKSSGGFSGPALYPIDSDGSALQLADLDNDGALDLFVVAYYHVTTFLNDGTGTFTLASDTVDVGFGTSAYTSRLADFDGDGTIDLLWASSSSGEGTELMRGNGDGTFADSVHLFDKKGPFGVGDLDEDGKADVVSMDDGWQLKSVLRIRLAATATTVAPAVDVALDASALSLQVVDADGDGHLDVVTTNRTDLLVLRGDGHGHLAAPIVLTIPNETLDYEFSVRFGDLNGDTIPDAVLTREVVYIAYGTGGGHFVAPSHGVYGGSSPWPPAFFDVNQDGRMDLAMPSRYGGVAVFTPY